MPKDNETKARTITLTPAADRIVRRRCREFETDSAFISRILERWMAWEPAACPFCGSVRVNISARGDKFRAVCSGCQADGPPRRSEAEAQYAWDNRDDEEAE